MLCAADSPQEHARLSTLIYFEEEFIRSSSTFMQERPNEVWRQHYSISVSVKGIFKLLGLSVLVLAVVCIQSYIFG